MGKQRNNSYLGAAEKRKEKAHSHTKKKLPQRRGRRRVKAHRDWSREELRKAPLKNFNGFMIILGF